MKVKVRNKDMLSSNLIEHVLLSRGVPKEQVTNYLFPDELRKPTYEGLDNIEEAVLLLKKHADNNSKIYIQIDTDADGMTSASIMYQFLINELKLNDENIVHFMENTKKHGISVDEVMKVKPDLVIVPDASSGEFEIHKQLQDAGIDVLVLDHHLVEGNEYSKHAVVVNNQLSKDFKHKGLTGANIVLLFCECYKDTFGVEVNLDKYLDLATVGMIADRGSLLDEAVFYYTQTGLKKIHNPLLKLIIANNYNIPDDKEITIKDVEYSIAPMINAVTRQSKDDDLKIVVDALFAKNYTVYNNRLQADTHISEEAYRRMNNARNRQSNLVSIAMEKLKKRIEEKESYRNKVLFVNSTGVIENSGINGLVAIKLAEEYKRPTLVMSLHDKVFKGSARNFSNSPINDFKGEIEQTDLFEYALGHSGAFGVGVSLKNAVEAVKHLNNQLQDVDYDLTYYTDLVYNRYPKAKDIQEIASNSHLWGQDIEEPTVYVYGVRVKKSDIRLLGKNGNTIKIDLGTCDGIKFKPTESEKRALTDAESDTIEINLVGKCSLNTYKGMNAPQIVITDFEVVELYSDSPFHKIDEFNANELPF